MKTVKVKKQDLLLKVKANLDKHIADYLEAFAGYKEQGLAELEERRILLIQAFDKMKQKFIDSDQPIRIDIGVGLGFQLAIPSSHEKDYRQVIAMLEMSVDEELTISSEEFACYVMDDWDWKQNFETVTSNYKNPLRK